MMQEQICELPQKIKEDLADCVDLLLDTTGLISSLDNEPGSAHAHACFLEALSYLHTLSERLTRLAQ